MTDLLWALIVVCATTFAIAVLAVLAARAGLLTITLRRPTPRTRKDAP